MLKRKAYRILTERKQRGENKLLTLTGARHVGKASVVRQFGAECYECFIEIDCEQPNAAKEWSGLSDTDSILRKIADTANKTIIPNNTLILFREGRQNNDITAIAMRLQQRGLADCMMTYSATAISHSKAPVYAIGDEEIIRMYPLDFEEYLWANGIPTETIDNLRQNFEQRTPVSNAVHETIMRMFRHYMTVGGMPEAVGLFVETHDMRPVNECLHHILECYRHDLNQCASASDRQKVLAIFDSIPIQLDNQKKRFYINALDPNARINRYEHCFDMLSESGLTLPCYNLEAPVSPIILHGKHGLFKLYLSDCGLLRAAVREDIQFDIMRGNLNSRSGSILENVIAQNLRSNGYGLYYYDNAKYGEVSFVLQNSRKLELLSVKSGHDYHRHTALTNVLSEQSWTFRQATILCKDNVAVEDNIVYLPFYMIMFLRPSDDPATFIVDVDISAVV